MNLYELIKINNYQGFSYSLIKRFAYSILQCLVLFHDMQIIHCDLKPENILLQANFKGTSAIKVIDVGSSCFVGKQGSPMATTSYLTRVPSCLSSYFSVYTYIQSRFYRSPEVILGLDYSLPIDIWSFGCIMAELYTGYPIFPGENEIEQLNCIMEVSQLVPHTINFVTKEQIFFRSSEFHRCMCSKTPRARKFSSILKTLRE